MCSACYARVRARAFHATYTYIHTHARARTHAHIRTHAHAYDARTRARAQCTNEEAKIGNFCALLRYLFSLPQAYPHSSSTIALQPFPFSRFLSPFISPFSLFSSIHVLTLALTAIPHLIIFFCHFAPGVLTLSHHTISRDERPSKRNSTRSCVKGIYTYNIV